MPKDQPNKQAAGANQPSLISTSISDIRDKQVFNERIFENPIQKAELPCEITVPATTDLDTISWRCGRCGHTNMPAKEYRNKRVSQGSVQGVMQSYQCDKCQTWLISQDEKLNVVESFDEKKAEKEAYVAEHPKALPIPGKEPSKKNMTDILAGHEVKNP